MILSHLAALLAACLLGGYLAASAALRRRVQRLPPRVQALANDIARGHNVLAARIDGIEGTQQEHGARLARVERALVDAAGGPNGTP